MCVFCLVWTDMKAFLAEHNAETKNAAGVVDVAGCSG